MDICRLKIILISVITILSYQTCHGFPVFPNVDMRYWGSVEYLHWWVQDSPISVPLATRNSNPASLAIIGQPGTEVVIGAGSSQNSFEFGGMNGARLTLGGWFDNTCYCGMEASVFGLAPKTEKLVATSGTDNPVVDVPFFSTLTGNENVLVGGRANSVVDKDTFQPSSIELNFLYRIPRTPCTRYPYPLILTAGFRFVNIDEKMVLNDAIYNTPGLPPGLILNIQDSFTARNHFYGLQLGARTKANYCDFVFEGMAQMAFGFNFQQLAIDGQTNVSNQTILQPIGLFAESTNTGNFKNSPFAVVPEFQIKIGYNGLHYLNPFITWNLFYMTNVNRPGKQIDRNINQSQNPLLGGSGVLTGAPAPLRQFHQTSLWMQGFGIGVEFG